MPPELAQSLQHFHDVTGPGLYVVAVLLMLLEGVAVPLYFRHWAVFNHWGGVVSSVCGLLANGLSIAAFLLLYLQMMQLSWEHRLWNLGTGPVAWVVSFLLFDLMWYLAHRMGHRVRLFWCFHGVHHTDEEMRLTTAIRGSAIEFLYLPWFFVWIPLLGIHPLILLATEPVSRLWGFLSHVSPRWFGKTDWLDPWLITPSLHRVHHGRNTEYLDTNYAQVFSFWDRLLGSYHTETVAPEYGVLQPVNINSVWDVQTAAFRALWRDMRAAPNPWLALQCALRPPGWKAGGVRPLASLAPER
jgi:sterol desaturase/sphingolipid hydroxylase (fatty acid hydroxylase superfamily)